MLLTIGFPAGGLAPRRALAALAGSPPEEGAVIRQVSITENNLIAYIKSDGIYLAGRGPRLRQLVAVGDEAPRTGGTFAEFLDLSSAVVEVGLFGLGNDLRIAFKARIEAGQVGDGIFLFSENQGVFSIALPGDIAPNTGGGVFAGFPDRVLINNLGTILFRATVAEGRASEGLFFAPRRFIRGEADIDSVAVQGDPATDTGGGVYSSFGVYDMIEATLLLGSAPPTILNIDVFGFVANVEGGRVPQALYVSSLAAISLIPLILELRADAVALVGNNAANLRGQSIYASFEDVVLTRNEVVFRARLNSAGADVLGARPTQDGDGPTEGVFQISSLGPFQVDALKVLQGRPAPVPGSRVTFRSFGRMVASNEEELVFEADLEGDGPDQGLFSVTLGPLTIVSETLSTGDPAPDTAGGVYARLGPLSMNDNGRVAFQAAIEGGNVREAVYTELAKRVRFVDGVQ